MLGAVEKRLRGIILGWRAEHAELELSAPVLQTSLSHPLSAVLSLGMSCGWFAAAGNRLCAWPGVRTWRKECLLLLSLLISPQGELFMSLPFPMEAVSQSTGHSVYPAHWSCPRCLAVSLGVMLTSAVGVQCQRAPNTSLL